MNHRLILFAAAALAWACSSDPTPTSSASVNDDTASDAGALDAGVADDAAQTDGDAGAVTDGERATDTATGPAADPTPLDKPLTKVATPEKAEFSGWVYAVHASGATIGSAIAAGTFTVPKPGQSAYGLLWQAAQPDAGGALGPYGTNQGAVWLAVAPTLTETTAFIARVDNVQQIYAGGRRLPGDIYGHGKARVPLAVNKGGAIVAIGRGGRKINLSAQKTTRELWLNPHDTTFADLRAGTDDANWIGVPLLNLLPKTVANIHARVLETDDWHASNTVWPGIAPLAVAHVGMHLRPKKPWPKAGDKDNPVKIKVKLRIEADDAQFAYDRELELTVIDADTHFRQSFRSPVDQSIQYYGVRAPVPFDPAKQYSMVLSLHGAGVEGIGQAGSYSKKNWVYIIAPTNRRPFGFDHEEWGHLNDLAAHNDALKRFPIDPLRKYVSGHSMGGHGTWQFGIHHAHEFALIGPSAGWDSFYTYGGSAKPKGPFARARAHSDTSKYMQNLANRGVYVIHGKADDNVPWSEGLAMHLKATKVSTDVHKHWQDGAGHWWDGDKGEGADCVDWPDLFDLMKNRTLDLAELNFRFRSPGPWYSDTYSYVRIRSAAAPDKDCTVQSVFDGATLKLFTTNVRSVEIDGKAVRSKGPQSIEVDGKVHQLPDGPLRLGPETGKRPGVHGPFNQVMHRPWCWVWPDDADEYRDFAAYLASHWAIIGNGSACALPASRLSEAIAGSHNLIHLGRTPQAAGAPAFASWTDSGATMAGDTFAGAAMQLIWDAGDRLGAAIVAPKGKRFLLYSVVPFSSRSGMPDFLLWRETGGAASGNFDANWQPAPLYASGLTGGE